MAVKTRHFSADSVQKAIAMRAAKEATMSGSDLMKMLRSLLVSAEELGYYLCVLCLGLN